MASSGENDQQPLLLETRTGRGAWSFVYMKVPTPPLAVDEGPPDEAHENLRLWQVEQKATKRIFEKIASTGTVVYKDERRDQRKKDKKPEQRYVVRWRKEADGTLVIDEPEVIRQYVDSPLVLSQWSRNNRLMKERLKILLQERKGLRLFTAKCGQCGEVSLEDIPGRLKEFHRRIAKLAGGGWAKKQELHFLLRKTELPVVPSREKDPKKNQAVVLLHAHLVVQCRKKLADGGWKELREHVKKKLGPGHDAAIKWSDTEGLERLLWYLFKNPLASRKQGQALVDGKSLSKSIPARKSLGSSLKYDALCELPADALKLLLQQLKNQHLVSPMGGFRRDYHTVKLAAKQAAKQAAKANRAAEQSDQSEQKSRTTPDNVLDTVLGEDGNRGRAVMLRPSVDKKHLTTNIAAAIKSKLAPAPPQNPWELQPWSAHAKIGRGIFWTSRASNHIDDALSEFPTGCLKVLPVTLRQLLGVGKGTPGLGFVMAQASFKDGIVPEVIYIPRLAAGGAMNIHGGLLSIEQGCHFLGAQVVRLLTFLGKDVNLHEGELRQANGHVLSPRPSRLVLVQHDDDLAVAVGVLADQLLLRG